MFNKNDFLKKHNISENSFKASGFTWDELEEIYGSYTKLKSTCLNDILSDFMEKYFTNPELFHIHSHKYRIKDPEHLIAKLIEKRNSNFVKYKDINSKNYWQFVTDLIGIRGLILYKDDWQYFHEHIIKIIENDASNYIENYIDDYKNDNLSYHAEKPKAYIRDGDDQNIYLNYSDTLEIKLSDRKYRSIHYIIKHSGYYIEIQIRTIFEEGWSEIDHDIVYPYNSKNILLANFSQLLNRVAGSADEMAMYFKKIKSLEIYDNSLDYLQEPILFNNIPDHNKNTKKKDAQLNLNTVQNILDNIINE